MSVIVLGMSSSVPRYVRIEGQEFVLAETGNPIVLGGVGDTICDDAKNVNDLCKSLGNCTGCTTFNQHDVDHIKNLGWNFIRLGVVWAVAQPDDTNSLDPNFVERLHALLNLTDANHLHVMLDNHGDMVGSAGCGNGLPMWVQQKAAGDLIGKPLHTDLPYSLVPEISIKKTPGYDYCGDDADAWAEHAGDPNYNLLNRCCQAMNSGNPGGLGFTTISQKSMDYVIRPGEGRDAFVRFWTLVAEEVKQHPSAFAVESMNEPMTIHRRWAFDTWRAISEAVTAVVPDMSVSVCDVGEWSGVPAWVVDLTGGFEDISSETEDWIKASNNTFYAWHYGTVPKNIDNMRAISKRWDIPTFGTELGCDQFAAAKAANISHSYWHYSSYCTTGPWFGNRSVPDDTFGACLLGWDGGDSSKCA
eukprot:g1949.t1